MNKVKNKDEIKKNDQKLKSGKGRTQKYMLFGGSREEGKRKKEKKKKKTW